MTDTPKLDLSDHEEEAAPFDDVLRKLLAAKPAPRKAAPIDPTSEPPPESDFA